MVSYKVFRNIVPLFIFVRRFTHNIWFFPFVITLLLLTLTVLRFNGSSVGIYQTYFNGAAHDNALIANKPRLVRSDEWRVNTQMILAQKNNHYNRINNNIGNGQDMSVIHDVPYKEWSELFRPHNWAFFVLPFEYAFAFKWWVMGYLLVLSCYFFTLALLPNKKLLASILSLSLFFSAFVQWWYAYGTLGCLYYSLFIVTTFIYLLKSKDVKKTIILSALLTYLLISFVLVLYPPFQIASGLAVSAISLGFASSELRVKSRKDILQKVAILSTAILLAVLVLFLFAQTRTKTIQAIQKSSYPGTRIVSSGGFDLPHLFSSHLSYQFRVDSRSANYVPRWFSNQSEASNFLLILPFLVLPSFYIIARDHRRKKQIDLPLIAVSGTFFLFLLWLFVPHLSFLGKITLLDRVPLTRVLIGLGLVNLFQIVLLIRRLNDYKDSLFSYNYLLIYTGFIFVVELALGLHTMNSYSGFIGIYRVAAFSIPMPVIIYLLLTKRFEWAAMGILSFSLFMSFWINPVYRGLAIVEDTKLSHEIKKLSLHDKGKWVIEDSHLENFAMMNGSHSLSGVYAYPQLDIWQSIDNGKDKTKYNRYAHTDFAFDRDTTVNAKTSIDLEAPDHFRINTEPCGSFLHSNNVSFIMTGSLLASKETCVQLVDTVVYPALTVYIYHIH